MLALVFTLLTSSAACLVLIPIVRCLATRCGLVDRPDGRRKVQSRPIALGGGIAILASAILGAAATAIIPGLPREQVAALWPRAFGLGLAALVICGVGVADDYHLIRGRHKLIGQAAAVAIVIVFGVMVRSINLFGWQLELGLLALPFTAFLLLGAINSLNLLDGMDGMLGSVGAIISLALAGMAAMAGNWAVAGLATALAGALLAFLRYNLPPASIYLGDSGSMLVGLVVGSLAIESSLKAPTTIALSAPVVLLTLPIFDTAAAIIRRKLTGRSIYTTDRGHLHHCLLRRGYSVWRVLLLVCSFSAATGLAVLASEAFNNEWIALLTGLAVVAILIVTRLFGFAEMVLVHERLRALVVSLFQSGMRGPTRQIEVRLQGSADWTELWDGIKTCAWELNLREVCLDVNAPSLHEGYHARWDRGLEEDETPQLWRAEIPLKVRGLLVGRLEVVGQPDEEPMWVKIAALSKALEHVADVLQPIAAPRREISVRVAEWELVPISAEG